MKAGPIINLSFQIETKHVNTDILVTASHQIPTEKLDIQSVPSEDSASQPAVRMFQLMLRLTIIPV